jgi:hypothetical protein
MPHFASGCSRSSSRCSDEALRLRCARRDFYPRHKVNWAGRGRQRSAVKFRARPRELWPGFQVSEAATRPSRRSISKAFAVCGPRSIRGPALRHRSNKRPVTHARRMPGIHSRPSLVASGALGTLYSRPSLVAVRTSFGSLPGRLSSGTDGLLGRVRWCGPVALVVVQQPGQQALCHCSWPFPRSLQVELEPGLNLTQNSFSIMTSC